MFCTDVSPYFFDKEVLSIRFIAIDQASAVSGLAIFEDDKLIQYNIIELKKYKNAQERVHEMIKCIHNQILKNNVDHVVFEDVSLQTNVSTLILLAQIQGAIINTCVMNNICYSVYKPTFWRHKLGFNQSKNVKRLELKQQAKDYVFNKYGLRLKEDICDAICIGNAFILENKKED